MLSGRLDILFDPSLENMPDGLVLSILRLDVVRSKLLEDGGSQIVFVSIKSWGNTPHFPFAFEPDQNH